MLGFRDKLCIIVALLSFVCITSAFSTHFVMEEMKKEAKMEEEKEKKAQKMENSVNENKSNPEAMEVKVIPLVTDIFTQTEDLVNMTPLKLATAISAQYLLTSIQNIPAAGSGAHDIFSMLQGIVKGINKTTEIIKLTAEFVNISSVYILSSLDQFIKSGRDSMIVEKEMGLLREKFLQMIKDHVQLAVKELNDKNTQQDMTGSDVLVSSARHTVGLFQEMTNEVLIITTLQNEQCQSPLLQNISSSVEQVFDEKQKTGDETTSEFQGQMKNHQTIKKDILEIKVENLGENLSKADLRGNQDVTLEVLPLEFYSQGKKMNEKKIQKDALKVPEVTHLEHYPFTLLFGNANQKEENNKLKSSGLNQNHSFFVSTVDHPEAKSAETNTIPKKMINPTKRLLRLTNGGQGYQKTPNQPCDEHVEPVCGIDININRFIIFLNECNRKNHNSVHGTNYVWFSMDTCVGIMLKNPNQTTKLAWNNELSP